MAAKHETLHITPYPALYKEKPLKYYEVRPGFKKPMAVFPTLKEAAEYAFKHAETIHVSRVKHTQPTPHNHSHWRKYTPKEIHEIQEEK